MRTIFGFQFQSIVLLCLLLLIVIVWLNNESEENLRKQIVTLTSENDRLKTLVQTFENKNGTTRYGEEPSVVSKKDKMKDEVVLSKTVLSNFRPKHVNEWIGDPWASLFQLFIAFLT
jgi:hypothetical protein